MQNCTVTLKSFMYLRLLQNPSLCPLEAGRSEGFCKV